ncbi:MAG: putative manganese transporter [Pseudomonadota bacterium]
MTGRLLQLRAELVRSPAYDSGLGLYRFAALAGLLLWIAADAEHRDAVFEALTDAYLGVGVFVAATFALFFHLEARHNIDAGAWLERQRRLEIPVAAALGALPGCGGAIMVITQFAMGRATFGSVVAVLTSTMGDAAFLLLAREPLIGLALIALGFVVGTLSGYLINQIHDRSFLAVPPRAPEPEPQAAPIISARLCQLWALIAVPGLIFGIAALFQIETPQPLTQIIGVGGALSCIALWVVSPTQSVHLAARQVGDLLSRRVALNTNFVVIWVIAAFLLYELGGGSEVLTPLFGAVAAPLVPLLGILVGFIMGCGPQIRPGTAMSAQS